jgi:diguanylate cyclase (GGDEF)-like protein
LSDFVGSMVTGASVEGILDRFVRHLVVLLPVTSVGVTLFGSDAVPSHVAASSPAAAALEELQYELMEGPGVHALEFGKACTVADLTHDERFTRYGPAALDTGLGAVFAFPMRSDGAVLAAVDLYRESPGELSADDLSAAQVLADVVATFVINARERSEREATSAHLRRIAHHDPLTRLPNRALLQDRLEQAARRRARSGRPFAVVFLDLDGFKPINDQYGHAAGDELLVAIAGRLRGVLRPADTLARLGGDEFVILTEELDDQGADRLVARVASQFADPFELTGATVVAQASVGVAITGQGRESPAALLRAADEAMYAQKRSAHA